MKISYRKNYGLIIAFLILISAFFVVALSLAYHLTRKYVDNEFEAGKVSVLEKSIASYNDFSQNRIPEVSFYQGFLDSASASKYADEILTKFPFVERLVFLDVEISQHYINHGFKFKQLHLSPKAVFQFGRDVPQDSILLYKAGENSKFSLQNKEEFSKMAIKFAAFLESADASGPISNEAIFNTFYTVLPKKISYMTLPRSEEIAVFKKMLKGKDERNAVYQQDMITYYLDPTALEIFNTHPKLYQHIAIKPVFYEEMNAENQIKSTRITLPGALAEYKIYFTSSKDFLKSEINNRFLPVAALIFGIYILLILLAYLIYRNLNVNLRMFKLQYDFVNNLSHEFKTPVSVIKIAGNNILNAESLSEKEKNFYGKILDEEADKLNNLLNTLLSFIQIENKVIKLRFQEIVLEEFCESIVSSYRVKYPDFDISFSIKDVKVFKTDLTLLTSVFQNLIDNAYRYSFVGKKYMRISIYEQNRQIFFKFEDKGIGIADSEKENVFKKFYRIESKYNQEGSVGLGLAFCKEVLKLMKGNISVESKKGKGSTFTIMLPYE